MKILIVLFLASTSAFGQSARSRELVRDKAQALRSAPHSGVKVRTESNLVYYAADPNWRNTTNQISQTKLKLDGLNDQYGMVSRKIELKQEARQPYKIEANTRSNLRSQQKQLESQVAALRLKQFEIEERLDRVPRVVVPKTSQAVPKR